MWRYSTSSRVPFVLISYWVSPNFVVQSYCISYHIHFNLSAVSWVILDTFVRIRTFPFQTLLHTRFAACFIFLLFQILYIVSRVDKWLFLAALIHWVGNLFIHGFCFFVFFCLIYTPHLVVDVRFSSVCVFQLFVLFSIHILFPVGFFRLKFWNN